jgi:uncharacterized protein (TIGR02466 family)
LQKHLNSQSLRPEVIHAFGTPLIVFDIPDSGALNASLREIILGQRLKDSGVSRSNVNGWHSGEDFVEWGGAQAQLIVQTFGGICAGLTQFPPQTGSGSLQWIVRAWANVSEKGAFNKLHYHPGAYWSGVYYVSDGRGDPEEEVGANLVIHSPHAQVASMYAPDVQIRLPDGQCLSPSVTVRPRPGRGVIFPSWLMHEVEPYRGRAVRISIALNFSLTPRMFSRGE